jgi:pSer/pThr/pTyr-binding forkhead associated (FHA) protein
MSDTTRRGDTRSDESTTDEAWRKSLDGMHLKYFAADRSHLDRDAFVAASSAPYLLTDMSRNAMDRCRVFPIKKREGTGGVEVGRLPENDVVIPCPTVSKRHCVFSLEDGKWGITDTSSNGILLGEEVIEPGKRIPLATSPAEISLGPDAKVWFVLPEDLYTFIRKLQSGAVDEKPAEPKAPAEPEPEAPAEPEPAPPAEPPTVKCLLVVKHQGNEMVRKVFDQRDVRIGRDPSCELTLDHAALSRQHALIRREGTVFVASDMGSSNGTLVNGKRITSKPLNPGDQIGVGEFVITFHTQRVVGLEADDVPDKEDYAAFGQTFKIKAGPDNTSLERNAGVRAHLVQEPESTTWSLDKDVFLIGKGELCDLKVQGFWAPRVAAAIVRGHGGFAIVSLGATAKRNGAPVSDRTFLEKEDKVEVQGVSLVFHLGAPVGGKTGAAK